ncbi:aryl-alcohol dehydrogenase [Moniliophthora roreri MCA 2997]|uniref:Aryl-alcohol dehydrogenase n=1 Tax=Moniliophthora roreri (strain MCA 2997) TaxID=1381753 RepID=V2YLM6_MONRO|nr:aryl-alcohol dehydrogenase [Moniliophthora roreri MCA 2997]
MGSPLPHICVRDINKRANLVYSSLPGSPTSPTKSRHRFAVGRRVTQRPKAVLHGYYFRNTLDMSAFAPVPPPPTKLGVYLTLAPRAGFHVSPLCFGAMSIGDKWNSFMGSMDKESSFKLLDVYLEMGDNFIDTANK